MAVTTFTTAEWIDEYARLKALGYTWAQIRTYFNDELYLPWGTEPTPLALSQYYPGCGYDAGDAVIISNPDGRFSLALIVDGDTIQLPDRAGATWTKRSSEPDTLTFSYPFGTVDADLFSRPNEIALYNRNGYVVEKFIVTAAVPVLRRDGGGGWLDVEAKSYLEKLGQSLVDDYPGSDITIISDINTSQQPTFDGLADGTYTGVTILVDDERMSGNITIASGGTEQTVSLTRGADSTTAAAHKAGASVTIGRSIISHVETLIADYQETASGYTAITIGDVEDFAGLDDIVFCSFAGQPLLDCIRELYRMSGNAGQIIVTPDNQFWWLEDIAGTGTPLRRGDNAVTIERVPIVDELVTRIVVRGSGIGSARLSVTKTNNTATYGSITRHVVLDGVNDAATLDAIATSLIAEFSVPRYTYHVVTTDAYAIGRDTLIPLYIGATCRVVDEQFGIDADAEVQAITRRLDGATVVEVELGTVSRKFDDVVSDIRASIAKGSTGSIDGLNRAIRTGQVAGVTRVNNADPREGDFDTSEGTVRQYIGGEWVEATSGVDVPSPGTGVQSVGSSNADGTSDDFARVNHVHAGPQPGIDIQSTGSSNAAGTSATWARSDHVHAGGGGASPGTGIQSVGSSNADGTSAGYARVDHVHSGAQPGTGIQSTGTANANGSSAAFARVDHVHMAVWLDYDDE